MKSGVGELLSTQSIRNISIMLGVSGVNSIFINTIANNEIPVYGQVAAAGLVGVTAVKAALLIKNGEYAQQPINDSQQQDNESI